MSDPHDERSARASEATPNDLSEGDAGPPVGLLDSSPADDALDTSRIALVGLIGAITTFVIIVFLMVMYYQYTAAEAIRDQDEPSAELATLVNRQQALLARYAWVNEQKKIAAIPIERAMQLVVAEYQVPAKPTAAKPQEGDHGR